MNKVRDLTGQKFGRLVVLRLAGTEKGGARWLAQCSCGSEPKAFASDHLVRGKTTSCGCARKHPMDERLRRMVEKQPDGCWLWAGYRDRDGYGRIQVDGMGHMAHRVQMSELGFDIEGMEVDHVCRVRACVNPDHLEVVTREENERRKLEVHRSRKQGADAA